MTMTFEDFTELIRKELPGYLPENFRDGRIVIEKTVKPSGCSTLLCVLREGVNIARAINLERYYEAFSSGESLETLLEAMARETAEAKPGVEDDLAWISDYASARSRLFVRLSHGSSIGHLAGKVPFTMVSDMVMTYHLLVNCESGCLASTMVTYGILEDFGVTPERLHNDAVENSPKILPAKVQSLDRMLRDMIDSPCEHEDSCGNGLWVVTNETGTDGAAALFYPGIMKSIAERTEGGYYILPSSVHEVIIMPEDYYSCPQNLNAMIEQINNSVVHPRDRLSDTAYHYDPETESFETLAEHMARIDSVVSAGDR